MPRNDKPMSTLDRRDFLKALGATLGLAGSGFGSPASAFGPLAPRADGRPLKVAAVITEFTYRSHAHVILENFLGPYLFNGKKTDPGMEVVSLYVDEFPKKDMSREISKTFNIPIYPTIGQALRRDGKSLAVDAVLSIGELGEYKVNEKGQREYPRKRFFDQIVEVFVESDKVVPVFNDKHLSYRWDWAKEMYDTAVRLGIPFMAGSSVPLAARRPPLEFPSGTEFTSAIAIHGGPFEAYDFHGLEVLFSIIEARKGGETGVSSVQFLEGDALWDAEKLGLWSSKLADAAMAAELGPGMPALRELVKQPPFDGRPPHGLFLTHKDGFRSAVLRIGKSSTRWNFAALVEEDDAPKATSFYTGPWENRNLFKAFSRAIQAHFRDGKAPYPIERTLMTTGVLDAIAESHFQGNKLIETPQLEFGYQAVDFTAMREMGDTWKLLTPDFPQPRGLDTSGQKFGT